MASAKWFPPLPSNYEARWDTGRKAFFFINHNDKTTSWDDPRFATTEPTASSQSQQHEEGHARTSSPHRHGHTHADQASPRAAAQLLNTNHHRENKEASSGHSGKAVPLDTFITQYGSRTVAGDYVPDEDSDFEDFDKLFQSTKEDSGHVDEANLRKIKQMFPNVPDKFILNALSRNHNVLSLTVSEITAAGYTKTETQDDPSELEARHHAAVQRLRAAFPTVKLEIVQDVLTGCNYNEESAKVQLISFGYHPKTHDNSRPSPSPKPMQSEHHQAAVPEARELCNSDKARLKNQMKSNFPSIEDSLIEMALISSKYDVNKAAQVLNSSIASRSRQRVSATTSGSTATGSVSPIKEFSGEMEPVVFGKDDHPNSQHSHSSTAITPSSSTHSTSSHIAKPAPQRHTPPPTSDERKTRIHKHNAKQDTQTKTQVVIAQPRDYISPYHSKPKGPDPSLRQGPNKNLLLDEYVANKGANPNLRHGPDPRHVLGPRGAQ